jgi:hypothetical protein
MLPDLLQMVRSPTVTGRASDFVVRVYGEEAVRDLDRAIGRALNPEALGFLTRLQSRVSSR